MKTAHIYQVNGGTRSEHTYIGNHSFESIPRIGEKILIPFDDGYFVYEIFDSLHSFNPDVADENLFVYYIGSYEEYLESPIS